MNGAVATHEVNSITKLRSAVSGRNGRSERLNMISGSSKILPGAGGAAMAAGLNLWIASQIVLDDTVNWNISKSNTCYNTLLKSFGTREAPQAASIKTSPEPSCQAVSQVTHVTLDRNVAVSKGI